MHRSRIVATIAAGVAALALVAAQPPADEEIAEEETADCRLIRGEDTPDDTSDDVEVCEQQVWFHRADTPVGNLGATDLSSFPSWDTNEPASYESGSGSGGGYVAFRFLDIANPHDPAGGATFEGTFTGPFDTLAVTIYHAYPDQIVAVYGNHTARLLLTVDGAELYRTSDASGNELTTTRVDRHLYKTTFAFTDLYEVMELFGLDTEGEHTVRLNVTPQYINTDNTVYLYDAAEVPSGMAFNRADLAGFTQLSFLD